MGCSRKRLLVLRITESDPARTWPSIQTIQERFRSTPDLPVPQSQGLTAVWQSPG
jgi:hypothetical protein